MKFGKLQDYGQPVEVKMIHGKCFVFKHKWKVARAGVVATKYKCERCGTVRNEPNVS